MAAQNQDFLLGSSRTFTSTKRIATKAHMSVWVTTDETLAIWVKLNVDEYDLISNSAVIAEGYDLESYLYLRLTVGDTPDETLLDHNATQLDVWETNATMMTSSSYATQPVDEFVIVYTSNGDGAYTETTQTVYSALHYEFYAKESFDSITTEGDAQVARVIAEGDTQDLRIEAEGQDQVDIVIAEGATQVARVTTEGSVQIGLCEDQVVLATAQADEIKAVGVVNPVASVPLLPNNVTGVPTVSYDDSTGLFTYGIPVGKTGEPAQVVTPTGAVTVAELNALGADPIVGAGYWMLDTGTVTYGDPDCVVTEINSVLIWLLDGYFFNMGVMEAGTSWAQTTGVTVDGYAPTDGDDLLPTTGGGMTGGLDMLDTAVNYRDSLGIIKATLSGDDNLFYIGMYNSAGTWVGRALNIDRETAAVNFVDVCPTASISPTNDNHLTRKDYVDTKLAKTGGEMSGNLVLHNNVNLSGKKVDGTYIIMLKMSTSDNIVLGALDQPITIKGGATFNDAIPIVNSAQGTDVSQLTRKDYVDAGANPIGAIIMFNGTFAKIPTNWQLCDGTNGTPNMADSFVMGTIVEADIGQTGGSNDAVVIDHFHGFTGTPLAGHAHEAAALHRDGECTTFTGSDGGGINLGLNATVSCSTAYKQSVSAGTPAGEVESFGVDGTGLNVPKYLKLTYIQRMS